MTREEQWLGAIAGMDDVTPPSMPVWHYEQMLAAIYDAVVGASPAREFPERSWHLDEFLWAVYCAVAGLADPGIPAPTCRIEEFWRGIYLKAMNDEDAAVPTPVWRIEEFLAEVFNNLTTAELKTVTGTMLHVLDALAKPAEELLVSLSPIQDLHGYSSPWPAGGGKNKFDKSKARLYNNVARFIKYGVDAYADTTPNGDLTLNVGDYVLSISGENTEAAQSLNIKDADGNTVRVSYNSKTLSFTISTAGAYIISINFTDVVTWENYNIQLESGSSATAWTPYSNICPITGRTGLSVYVSPTQNQADATTYAVDWTSVAGTVYGGTLDVATGVLTVDTVCATKALSAFSLVETKTNTKHYRYLDNFFGSSLPLDAESGNLCNIAPNAYNTSDSVHFFPVKSNGRIEIWVPTDLPTSTEVQIAVPIATPLTYQLTPQEVELIRSSLNNIWNDAGQTTLTYALMIKWSPAFSVNNVDFSNMVERDSYKTALIPVFGQTIQTLNGVGHTAMLRKKGRLTVKLNPQTDADTAAVCAELLNLPCEVLYHCLQRDLDVTALMTLDSVSAQFLSRCLYRGQKWNQTDDITLTEL